VVIPKELRKAYGIEAGDPIEFYTADGEIILRKYQPGCVFCGETENLETFHGKHVCGRCRGGLAQSAVLPMMKKRD
jgi:transcriptional pleiotropic regulator of transition state genes